MALLGEAIERVCADEGLCRVNYEILVNTDTFLHAHVFPRYTWEPADRITMPVFRYPDENWRLPAYQYDDARHGALRLRIRETLELLTRAERGHDHHCEDATIGRIVMEPFSFLSGNLRGWSSPTQDGEHAWVYRAPHYAALLRDHAPHLIGFQEFHPSNGDDVAPALPFHAWELGCECDTEQYTPIYWDTRRFGLIRTDSCWLNRWRTVKAVDWGANHERAVTWVELMDRQADRIVLVVNTHLDHISEPA
ncbi:MAG TPA: hypothetical protein VGR22_03040, partial [Thermomicrobiales bacterium]|nr:hypothetical protein [Thermomicrobiales bacterium]